MAFSREKKSTKPRSVRNFTTKGRCVSLKDESETRASRELASSKRVSPAESRARETRLLKSSSRKSQKERLRVTRSKDGVQNRQKRDAFQIDHQGPTLDAAKVPRARPDLPPRRERERERESESRDVCVLSRVKGFSSLHWRVHIKTRAFPQRA